MEDSRVERVIDLRARVKMEICLILAFFYSLVLILTILYYYYCVRVGLVYGVLLFLRPLFLPLPQTLRVYSVSMLLKTIWLQIGIFCWFACFFQRILTAQLREAIRIRHNIWNWVRN